MGCVKSAPQKAAAEGEEGSVSTPLGSKRWTDAGVLVDLRNHMPGLKELEGWGGLTEGSDLRAHELVGIDVNGEGRVTGIGLDGKGLEGERASERVVEWAPAASSDRPHLSV